MKHKFNPNDEGISEDEIPDVISHIRKSSFYVMTKKKYAWVNNNEIVHKANMAITIVTLLVTFFVFESIFSMFIALIPVVLIVSLAMYVDWKLFNYYSFYDTKPVNDMTFEELQKHEPTMRFIFSGEFKNMGRNDLTNETLFHSYVYLNVKQKHILKNLR